MLMGMSTLQEKIPHLHDSLKPKQQNRVGENSSLNIQYLHPAKTTEEELKKEIRGILLKT